MFGKPLVTAAKAAGRTLPALALAAAVLTSAVGAPVPALAQGPVVHDHRKGGPTVARIQVILKNIHIIDDHDWGAGEFDFWFSLICHQKTTACPGGVGGAGLDGIGEKFSANSGAVVPFVNGVLPRAEPTYREYDSSVDGGYPLRAGHTYSLRFGMTEMDGLGNNPDVMGDGRVELSEENGWGVGTHKVAATRNGKADFELELEVRRMVLPDLRAVNIKVTDLPGSTKDRVCMAVQNIEPGPAPAFEMQLRVDGTVPFDGRGTAPGLTPGNATEVCVETQLPATGPLKLEAIADPLNALTEYNEANNIYEQSFTPLAQPSAPSTQPQPQPGAGAVSNPKPDSGSGDGKADLTVSAIKVNGQVPDGKNDCQDGKNGVTAIVKNAGAEKAAGFMVRLMVDGDEAAEATVDGLDAGKEREVRFGDVKLKKGDHKLSAVADAKKAVAEADENNNTVEAQAGCKSDA